VSMVQAAALLVRRQAMRREMKDQPPVSSHSVSAVSSSGRPDLSSADNTSHVIEKSQNHSIT